VHVGSVQDCRRVPFQSWADGGRLREALAAPGRRPGSRRPPPRPRAAARPLGGRLGSPRGSGRAAAPRTAAAAAAGWMAGAVGDLVARAHIGLQQQHRLVPRPTGLLQAMAVAGRARAARKCVVREVDLLDLRAAHAVRSAALVGQVSGGRLAGSLSRCHTRTKS
jgi:hypothetical protein